MPPLRYFRSAALLSALGEVRNSERESYPLTYKFVDPRTDERSTIHPGSPVGIVSCVAEEPRVYCASAVWAEPKTAMVLENARRIGAASAADPLRLRTSARRSQSDQSVDAALEQALASTVHAHPAGGGLARNGGPALKFGCTLIWRNAAIGHIGQLRGSSFKGERP